MAVSNQAADEINQEVDRTTMARMLDVRNVLQLIDDRLNNGAFAKE